MVQMFKLPFFEDQLPYKFACNYGCTISGHLLPVFLQHSVNPALAVQEHRRPTPCISHQRRTKAYTKKRYTLVGWMLLLCKFFFYFIYLCSIFAKHNHHWLFLQL